MTSAQKARVALLIESKGCDGRTAPIGRLCRGYRVLMGTSSEVNSLARPCFGSTSFGKLLKQRDSTHQLCIQCFKAIATLFVALPIRYSTLALGVQMSA